MIVYVLIADMRTMRRNLGDEPRMPDKRPANPRGEEPRFKRDDASEDGIRCAEAELRLRSF